MNKNKSNCPLVTGSDRECIEKYNDIENAKPIIRDRNHNRTAYNLQND